jgi:hypothetical protein
MKKRFFFTVFLIILQNVTFSQSIEFSKDSLHISGDGAFSDIYDSLFLYNTGASDLIIDSIYSNKIYGYPVDIYSGDTSYLFYLGFDKIFEDIIISPGDSVKLIFYMPDLCPICEGSSPFQNFSDTLYFLSNALNYPVYTIYIDGEGYVSVGENPLPVKDYSLEQNYPNPFNPHTRISYAVYKPGVVRIIVYDILGRVISAPVNEFKSVGRYTLDFDASGLPSGIYFYQMKINDFIETNKMILMR